MAFILALPILKGLLDNPLFDMLGNTLDKLSDIQTDIEVAGTNVKKKLNNYAEKTIFLRLPETNTNNTSAETLNPT